MSDTSIWMRNRLRENSGRTNITGGARYYGTEFEVIPSVVSRTPEEVAELAKEEFGPPVNPRKSRNRQA